MSSLYQAGKKGGTVTASMGKKIVSHGAKTMHSMGKASGKMRSGDPKGAPVMSKGK
jgi:hypothetical protein